MNTKAMVCGAVLAASWTAPAWALRPFVGTDAAVAAPGDLELELGNLGYLREGSQKSVLAPAAVVNLGLEKGNELVLEGLVRTRLNPEAGSRRTSFEEGAVSIKHMLRDGVMQEAKGPSIASECGVLIPTLQGERTGASCAGILSTRWGETTAHFNAALSKNREGNWERFLGVIVAGPSYGALRPVFETFVVRDSAGLATNSALAGLLWTVSENLQFDIALRKARSEGQGVTEIRAGLTWTRPARH